ncbi:Uncharacterised protein [Tatumella ptyseos]|uniref:Uncharacterized protein n=1 Tax=Tatumella ptyseos TaxID=82987 RepID=A0A2X5NXH2_9GAMM|nr:Uncharacterised protein [Tatumella ptyseos]
MFPEIIARKISVGRGRGSIIFSFIPSCEAHASQREIFRYFLRSRVFKRLEFSFDLYGFFIVIFDCQG